MVKDEWVRAAMTDDMVVVELLIRLKRSQAASLSAKSQPVPAVVVPHCWGLKRPRSRLTAVSRCEATVSRRKEADLTRCSPTTPLSWSDGASPSVTADGYEESSRPTVVYGQDARSKATATATSEYTGNSSSTKRCRRKKTFAELKEEESVLLKERIYLEKEIANLSATFKVERTINESLKRMKLDLGPKFKDNTPRSTSDEYTHSGQPLSRAGPSEVQTHATEDDTLTQSDSKAARTESSGESLFLIPDLNMMPSESDSYPDALCGRS